MLKIDRSLAGNIDFAVVKFRGSAKKSRKMSLVTLQNVKIGGRLARNARFGAPACLVSGHWFSGSFAVSTGESCKTCPFGTKLRKLEEISHEMLVLVLPRVMFRVSGSLWLRRVYGGSRKTSPFRRFPCRLSCRFAWQAWHFVTFQPVCDMSNV